jgi:uncharacterized protein (TIGR03437 family)
VRSITFLAAFLASSGAAFPGSILNYVPAPNQMSITALAQDSAGNLYLAGALPNATANQPLNDAVVVKLSSDGKTVLYSITLPTTLISAMALEADGSIVVTGETASGFPVTANAAEPQDTGSAITGFFAHLNAAGAIAYATYLNVPTAASIPAPYVQSIAVDSSGAAYITGLGLFDSTPGALPPVTFGENEYFVAKIDATGTIDFITGAIGGSVIAVDSQGFIYIAGTGFPPPSLPTTPGAYQPSPQAKEICSGSISNSGGVSLACTDQYVVKLNPTGSAIVYATWLSGSFGAVPSAISVDAEGNVVVAGSTQSADYPVTPGAYQTANFATAPAISYLTFPPPISAPPVTSYVTKLNSTGSALIFSTYLGGSGQDWITSIASDSEGNFNLSGVSESPDFPGLPPIPDQCRAGSLYPMPFLTRLTADGSSLTETQLVYGFLAYAPAQAGSVVPLAVFGSQGTATLAWQNRLAFLDLDAPDPNLICATDAADLAPLAQVSPGQLVSLFGNGIGVSPAVASQPQNGMIPTSAGATTVTFNGVAAPVLYSSPDQINVQVPYEIANQPDAAIEIASGSASVGAGNLLVAPIQPSVFAPPQYANCQGLITADLLPLALNADASLNSCANPAAIGSTVTLFVNGLGLAGATPVTGAISPSPATPLALSVALTAGTVSLVSAESDPGSIDGVWRVQLEIEVPNYQLQNVFVTFVSFTVGGVPIRDQLVLWVSSPFQ